MFFVCSNWYLSNCKALNHILDIFGKLSTSWGALAWFHNIWTYGVNIIEYQMISSLKINLNHNCEFQMNSDLPLVFLERSQWLDLMEFIFVSLGLMMGGILKFKWFLSQNF
jgi:hypothetical protein